MTICSHVVSKNVKMSRFSHLRRTHMKTYPLTLRLVTAIIIIMIMTVIIVIITRIVIIDNFATDRDHGENAGAVARNGHSTNQANHKCCRQCQPDHVADWRKFSSESHSTTNTNKGPEGGLLISSANALQTKI